MACTGNKTVCVTHLHHHDSIVDILVQKGVLCLLRSHALLLSQLDQLVDVALKLITLLRINHGCLGKVYTVLLLLLCNDICLPDQDDICDILLDCLGSGTVCSLILGLRQNNSLSVRSRLRLDFIHESHNKSSFPVYTVLLDVRDFTHIVAAVNLQCAHLFLL